MRSTQARTYRNLPSLPGPVTLDDWRFSIVRPVARTNLILNPSVETNTTGYTASGASIARSTTFAYHGAYSLAITPTAATTDGVYYTTSTLTSGTVYAISVKVLGTPGRPYRLAAASNAGTVLQTQAFIGTGQWQWVTMLWAAPTSATHRIYIAKNGGTQTAIFYMDGLQLEACAANEYFPTTYIDGDQLGLLGAVELPPFYWTGTPHASTSVRSGQTRAGGRVVPLSVYRFAPTNIQGLGMAPVQPITTPFAQLDGSQFLDLRKTDRSVTITGRWLTTTPYDRQRKMAALMADLDRDLIATRQPLTILAEPLIRGKPVRAPLFIPALSYVDGLSGDLDSLPTGESIISFTQYQPRINGGDTGAALSVQATLSTDIALQRNPQTGAWARLVNTVTSGGSHLARAIAAAPDGTLYVGGDFTSAGGVAGVNYLVSYANGAWANVGTAPNGSILAMAFAPNGNLYVSGTFTSIGGSAIDRIAMWNGSVWAALGAGLNNDVTDIVIGPDGNLYAAGYFINAGGVANADYVAMWNGSVWAALGTTTDAPLQTLAVALNGDILAGGQFTTIGGVSATRIARWNGTTWVAMGTGLNDMPWAIAVGLNGSIYVGGQFTTAGGIAASRIAQWNGTQWSALGSGMGNTVYSLFVNPMNGLLYAGGPFTTAGGLTANCFAIWNGNAWVRGDITLGSGNHVYGILVQPDGAVTLALTQTGSATISAQTTVTAPNTVAAYPRLTIIGPTSGTGTVLFIGNSTTGKSIYGDVVLLTGEILTIILDPQRLSVFTNMRVIGVLGDILPGSDMGAFILQPGTNILSILCSASTMTAAISWPNDLASLEDGWTK